MTNEVITVPTGLTTDGLISRRYLARFIDSLIIALITLAIIKIEAAFLPGIRSGLTAIAVNLLFLLVSGLVMALYLSLLHGRPQSAKR